MDLVKEVLRGPTMQQWLGTKTRDASSGLLKAYYFGASSRLSSRDFQGVSRDYTPVI